MARRPTECSSFASAYLCPKTTRLADYCSSQDDGICCNMQQESSAHFRLPIPPKLRISGHTKISAGPAHFYLTMAVNESQPKVPQVPLVQVAPASFIEGPSPCFRRTLLTHNTTVLFHKIDTRTSTTQCTRAGNLCIWLEGGNRTPLPVLT